MNSTVKRPIDTAVAALRPVKGNQQYRIEKEEERRRKRRRRMERRRGEK